MRFIQYFLKKFAKNSSLSNWNNVRSGDLIIGYMAYLILTCTKAKGKLHYSKYVSDLQLLNKIYGLCKLSSSGPSC